MIFVVWGGIPYILARIMPHFLYPKIGSKNYCVEYTGNAKRVCIILLKKYLYTFFGVKNYCLH